SLTTEDLVVGEHAERWLCALEHETLVHGTERQVRSGRDRGLPAYQFLQPLQLTGIVAQDVRFLAARSTDPEQRVERLHVTLDRLRFTYVEADIRRVVFTDHDATERFDALARDVRLQEQRIRRLGIAAALPLRIVQVNDLLPRSCEL